jgi:hypothetical protein
MRSENETRTALRTLERVLPTVRHKVMFDTLRGEIAALRWFLREEPTDDPTAPTLESILALWAKEHARQDAAAYLVKS